jgi:hypothetical protein
MEPISSFLRGQKAYGGREGVAKTCQDALDTSEADQCNFLEIQSSHSTTENRSIHA